MEFGFAVAKSSSRLDTYGRRIILKRPGFPGDSNS